MRETTTAATTAKKYGADNSLLATSSGGEAKPPPTDDTTTAAATVVPTHEYHRAKSLISIWGPCRRVGDAYLSCVVTSGMGMCKPLRGIFEQCARETSEHAGGMLDQLALQACSHIDKDESFLKLSSQDQTIVKRNCAAEVLLRSQPQGPMQ